MPKDVLITPASGLIDFKDTTGVSDATIQLDDSGNLTITNSGGVLSIGNTAANVYIGDGTNSVDIIFEQSGKIRALTGKTLTLGQSDSSIAVDAPTTFNTTLTANNGLNTSYAQSIGRNSSWGSTNGTSTGAINAIMGTSTNATWIWSGTSGGVFRAGFQAYDPDGQSRLYTNGNFVAFNGNSITAGGTLTGNTLTSSVATGTAPLTVASTTTVTNLSADLLDGSHRDTAYNSFGNGTIPIRHSSGYLFSNYFNCTADVTTTAPSHIAIQTSSDNYIRWQTTAQFKSNLSLTLQDLPDAWVKRAVKAATTANITLSAPQTIDGISVVAGDRVLVKNQTAGAENGIYVVAAGAWTRATDADTSSKIAGGQVAVDQGTANGGTTWDNDFKSTDTLGTTAMPWNIIVDSGRLVTSGSTVTPAAVGYNGTTALAGQFDGGTTTPTGSTRLNYGGYFYPTYINLVGSGDTATAATHYFVETGTDGFVRPKTLANAQAELVTTATVAATTLTAGSTSAGALKYNGTTATTGQLDGGTTNPSATTRLNYGGNFYATNLYAGSNGSAASPSISFAGDPNSGFYTNGSDTLYITTNGTDSAYFDADGDATIVKQLTVGGTVSPAVGPILTLGTLSAGGSGYRNGTYTNVPLTQGTGTYALGTAVVSAGVVTSFTLTWGGHRYTAADSLIIAQIPGTIATTAASGTGTTATLTFAAQTVAPFQVGAKITVAGVTPTGYNVTNATVTACTTTTVSYANATTGAQTVAGTITAGTQLTNATIPVSTIQPATVTVNRYVSDAIGPRIRLECEDTATTAGQELGAIVFASRDGSTQASGDLGLFRGLAVSTAGGCYFTWSTAAGATAPVLAMTLDSSTNLTVVGNVTAYSDAKFKENVVTVDNALSKTLALRGVYYNKIDDDTKRRKIGVIAQEIQQVLPEVVFTNDAEKDTLSVDYGNIVGLLIEAIKEQNERITKLEEIIAKMQ